MTMEKIIKKCLKISFPLFLIKNVWTAPEIALRKLLRQSPSSDDGQVKGNLLFPSTRLRTFSKITPSALSHLCQFRLFSLPWWSIFTSYNSSHFTKLKNQKNMLAAHMCTIFYIPHCCSEMNIPRKKEAKACHPLGFVSSLPKDQRCQFKRDGFKAQKCKISQIHFIATTHLNFPGWPTNL